jgi:BirA family biotin operon repressor/biotin-[acetyl-CoA-carboxylase] ligase
MSRAAPEGSTPAALRLPPAFRLITYERLASSNDEAKRLAQAGAEDGTIVWARTQTSGRGRRGRAWQDLPGNLAASLILRPDCPPAAAAQLGFVAALALGETVLAHLPAGVRLAYKWPNDVLLNGGKVAGILLESETAPTGAVAFVVLGIGVNIAGHPEGTDYPATSLGEAGCLGLSAPMVLEGIARYLLLWRDRWRVEGFAPVRTAWLERSAGLGEAISVRLGERRLAGRFAGLGEDGSLLLETGEGRRRIAAGDMFPPGSGEGG